jgi:hypothetical protein
LGMYINAKAQEASCAHCSLCLIAFLHRHATAARKIAEMPHDVARHAASCQKLSQLAYLGMYINAKAQEASYAHCSLCLIAFRHRHATAAGKIAEMPHDVARHAASFQKLSQLAYLGMYINAKAHSREYLMCLSPPSVSLFLSFLSSFQK